jgi:hypothetical protein
MTLPLPVLLSKALLSLTRDYEQEGAGTPPLPSLTMWSNVLRHITDDGIERKRLPALARLTKRAVAPAVTELQRSGLVTVEDRVVRLTDAGRQARDRWLELIGTVERRWSERVGDEAARALRAALDDLVGRLEFEYSHHPASYGSADTTITGWVGAAGSGGGADWRFVPREPGDDLGSLPLSALLSQALVAFSVDFERIAGWSLAATTSVINVLDEAGSPVRDVPPVGALRWHGLVQEFKDGRTKMVRLTERGLWNKGTYMQNTRSVEADWRARYGASLVDGLRASLEAVVARAGDDLPDHPSMLLRVWRHA